MTKDVRVYLAHILECVDKIERFTAEGRARFIRDPMVQDAVIRNLEVMGEAAKRIDGAFRADHPEVPWRELASLRDVLIHQYAGVDIERVWVVVERDLPRVREGIGPLVPRMEELEEELASDTSPPPD
jgi:uncharacterized protein with HEPN domain